MFWKRKARKFQERIIITLPEDFDEATKYKRAVNRYLCEHHSGDLYSGRIAYGCTYYNPTEYIELLIDEKCNLNLHAMFEYVNDSRD